jgi:hypothetical protein
MIPEFLVWGVGGVGAGDEFGGIRYRFSLEHSESELPDGNAGLELRRPGWRGSRR